MTCHNHPLMAIHVTVKRKLPLLKKKILYPLLDLKITTFNVKHERKRK